MILCHSKLLPPVPRLQKIISFLWLQSINRCPVNASSGGKGNIYTQKLWEIKCLQKLCWNSKLLQIYFVRIWDIDVNLNKP